MGEWLLMEALSDYTSQLQLLMQQVGCKSFAALSRTSGLSRTHISRVRQGRILDLPLKKVLQLSQTLQVELDTLLSQLSSETSVKLLRQECPKLSESQHSVHSRVESDSFDPQYLQLQQTVVALKQECQHQQQQLQTQPVNLKLAHQKSTVQALESLLIQWPTAAYAARKNPEAPAIKLLPLLRPLEQLLAAWGVVPIGEVGAEVAYNPQWHQVMPVAGQDLKAGDRARVRYVGYRRDEQLLYRAKVSPV